MTNGLHFLLLPYHLRGTTGDLDLEPWSTLFKTNLLKVTNIQKRNNTPVRDIHNSLCNVFYAVHTLRNHTIHIIHFTVYIFTTNIHTYTHALKYTHIHTYTYIYMGK